MLEDGSKWKELPPLPRPDSHIELDYCQQFHCNCWRDNRKTFSLPIQFRFLGKEHFRQLLCQIN